MKKNSSHFYTNFFLPSNTKNRFSPSPLLMCQIAWTSAYSLCMHIYTYVCMCHIYSGLYLYTYAHNIHMYMGMWSTVARATIAAAVWCAPNEVFIFTTHAPPRLQCICTCMCLERFKRKREKHSYFKLAAIENKIMTEIAYCKVTGVAVKKTSFHKLHCLQQ